MVRYVDAEGETLAEMRENARKSDLYAQGDMKLVWVNEGDLSAQELNAVFRDLARQQERLDPDFEKVIEDNLYGLYES